MFLSRYSGTDTVSATMANIQVYVQPQLYRDELADVPITSPPLRDGSATSTLDLVAK